MVIYYITEYYHAINKYVKKDDWYVWVGMNTGVPTMPIFQSLEAFWPGLLVSFLIFVSFFNIKKLKYKSIEINYV